MAMIENDPTIPLYVMGNRKVSMEEALSSGPSKTAAYLSWVGAYLETKPTLGSFIWYHTLGCVYISYTLFFISFAIFYVVTRYSQSFWILHCGMAFKCIVLRLAMSRIRSRVKKQSERNFLAEASTAVNRSRQYFLFTEAINVSAIIFYMGCWSDKIVLVDYGLGILLTLGTAVFAGYMGVVILFSISDARVAQSTVKNLIDLAEQGELTAPVYSECQTSIESLVESAFWTDGVIVISILLDSIGAIVLLVVHDRIIGDVGPLHAVSFLYYVLAILWASDIVFLYFIAPEIAQVNELASQLHSVLAESKWPEPVREADRYDTLHRVIVKPIRYTIAGVYLTMKGVKNRLIGLFAAISLSVLRAIIMIAME
mmetsp:Transcript_3822/g.5943  ORF Transcript_3822/g.5943 Transcript_3822/m.5943 type:complete len:370 (-) Transcript_3822:6-1115(-)